MDSGHTRRQLLDGYPLRELLAVTLIIGLLAGIAIPLFLDQRKKGHDAAAKASLDAVATAIVDYTKANQELPTVTVTGSIVTLNDGTSVTLGSGVILGALTGTTDAWCIDDKQPHGNRAKIKGYKYSATKDATDDKVAEGQCA
ncbi:type IV pilin protein [Demequina lutea]|uniref:Type II secretory pathway pseudopilin PulG n=1 Tax=Demequina lutea TaxID=431489 RepID=A0A7Y9Z889_9MICO|nr:prepilin-type N-terminal cleavage/methylation domain-containing protein [Demequina lutea]NYI40040.1 type II secretory pathway pseudopilin PulG [Demequina lutea]